MQARRRRLAAGSIALLLSLGGVASPAAAIDGDPSEANDDLGEVLQRQLDESGIPGAAAVIVDRYGGVEAVGTGSAGGSEKVTPTTPFVIGSTTKSFTTLAVMQLVDSGDVDLDAPVREYVPELRPAPGEPADDITVRHLLQQTSGLDDFDGGPLLASAADGTPEQAVAELDGAELASTPGETWRYANANFVLAGLVVERASDLSYGDFVQRRILAPLGMTHSHVSLEAAETDGLTDGHRFWFGVPVATRPTWRQATLAAGYLISTASDLGRYLSMYLAGGLAPDGSRVVSAAAISTMLTAGPAAHLGPWAEGADARYAMGWFRGGPWSEDAVFHAGNTPDSSAMLAFFPERGIAVAVITNAGHELPAPGNPSITDRVARNVIHAALGQPVPDLPSLGVFYLLFDLIVLVLVTSTGWGTLRAGRAVWRHPAERTARRRAMRWLGVAVRTAAAGVLLVVPLQSYGWRGLWTWAPDLAVVLATLAALLAGTAALRVVALVRSPPAPLPMSPTTERNVGHAHA